MSKSAFVARVQAKGSYASKRDAEKAVDDVFGAIEEGLKEDLSRGAKGASFRIMTFGTFSVSHRAARRGRNPQTGAEIKIGASKALRFKPAKSLKDAAGC